MAEPPWLSRISLSLLPAVRSACSQVGGLEFALSVAHERLVQSFGAFNEIETEAALGAEEVAVDPALVAIVGANNLRAVVGLADAQGDFAAVAAMGADGRDVVHLPRARLVAIAAAGERAHRADIDAHAALLAVEVVAAVRSRLRN